MPDGNGERQDIDMLLNALERRYEVITFNVVGVISDYPQVDALLRDLAMEIGQGKKAIFEKAKEPKPVLPKNGNEKAEIPADPPAATTEEKIEVKQKGQALPNKHCAECGNEFTPKMKNSKYCSPKCASRAYNRKFNERRGDGIIKGSLRKQ